jgi:hypothetical protein
VDYEVTPEPTPEELEALVLALDERPDTAYAYWSAWRAAGLVGNEEE